MIKRVVRRFDMHAALDHLTLQLAQGQIGCLLGPSGCGKTTALRCIAGFETIDAGVIRAAERVLASSETFVLPESRKIGMVFQDAALFPHLTVEKNVAFGLHHWSRELRGRRVAELLDVVGLSGYAHHYPHQLSGGQQQRVALARALAPQPDLVLLDEPFSNLDTELRERLNLEVRAILKNLRATALLVTHDQHEAFAVADVIGVMRAGKLEQWDSPYEIYHRPATRFVADFIGQGVFLKGIVLGPREVQTELGVVRTHGAQEILPAGEVDVLLRPDDVIHDDDSTLRAEVCQRTFRGAEFLYTLKLPSGALLLSLVPSHHDHAIGERIGIRIEADHVVVFPRES